MGSQDRRDWQSIRKIKFLVLWGGESETFTTNLKRREDGSTCKNMFGVKDDRVEESRVSCADQVFECEAV